MKNKISKKLVNFLCDNGYLLRPHSRKGVFLFEKCLNADFSSFLGLNFLEKYGRIAVIAGAGSNSIKKLADDALEVLSQKGGGVTYSGALTLCTAVLFNIENLDVEVFEVDDGSGLYSEFLKYNIESASTPSELIKLLINTSRPFEWFRPGLSQRLTQIVAASYVSKDIDIEIKNQLYAAEVFLKNDGHVPSYGGSFVDGLFNFFSQRF